MEKATIWTRLYSPFTMGGSLNEPISTEVDVIERRTIQGFDFFTFQTPKGTLRVAEAQTGGIVADSFSEALANIKGCSKKELQTQIDEQKPSAVRARKVSYEEFFDKYKY